MNNKDATDATEPATDEIAHLPARSPNLALPILLIAALALLTMGRSCGHQFTSWDDEATVSHNPDFNPPTFAGVMRYWREPYMELYVPVTYTVWGGLARFSYGATGRLDPHVFHLFNVVLHATNAVLMFLLVRRLMPASRWQVWAAFAGATVFAVHPVQVETVSWMSGAKDLLYGFFTLIALLCYVTLVRGAGTGPGKRKWPRWVAYALGTVAFILAMLSKPTAIVTPVMAMLIDLLLIGRPWRAVVRTVLPWALLAIPCVIWTKLVQSTAHVDNATPLAVSTPVGVVLADVWIKPGLVVPVPNALLTTVKPSCR